MCTKENMKNGGKEQSEIGWTKDDVKWMRQEEEFCRIEGSKLS